MGGNLNIPPPEVYAAFPEPNYINPVRRSWMPIHAGILTGLSSVTVITRLYLRATKQAGPLGLDDALLLPAWLASIAFTVFTLLSTERYGSGTHTWDVPPTLWEPLAMSGWSSEVTYLISTGCTKCSILLFYRRLTKGTYNMRWKYAIFTAIAITVAYCTVFLITLGLACTPTEAYWKSWNPTYNEDFECRNSKVNNALSGIMSVVSDFYSVLLPCLMLRNFDAPRRQKIALNVIFCLGLIVVACGSVRTFYLHQLGQSIDLTWAGYDVLVWAQLEVQLSLICASAPVLRVLFRMLSGPMSRAFSSNRSNSLRASRRTSQRLTEENRGKVKSMLPSLQLSSMHLSSMHLSSKSSGKQDTLSTMSEMDIESGHTPDADRKRSKVAPSGESGYALQDLEVNRPPVAYPLREKRSADDPFGETRRLKPSQSRQSIFGTDNKL